MFPMVLVYLGREFVGGITWEGVPSVVRILGQIRDCGPKLAPSNKLFSKLLSRNRLLQLSLLSLEAVLPARNQAG
jgi:hypothetical protein